MVQAQSPVANINQQGEGISDMRDNDVASRVASTATYTGSTLSVSSAAAGTVIPPNAPDIVLGLTLNQWSVTGIIFGMLMAVAGLIANIYFQRKRLALMMQQHNAGDPKVD